MSETNLKNNVLRWLKKNYPEAFIYKAADRFTSGIPDLILCIDGYFLGIELKVPGNKPTPIQEYVMEQIRKAAGRTAVAHSVEEVQQFLDEVIKGR